MTIKQYKRFMEFKEAKLKLCIVKFCKQKQIQGALCQTHHDYIVNDKPIMSRKAVLR